jgi:hypothetical protein
MDWQPYINLGIGSAFAVIGWLARELWSAVQELKSDIKKLEVSLPTDYVRKDDLHGILNRIYSQLERIENKLDGKVDR